MKKTKKKLLLCGLLTLFAAANLFVAASNEKQKSLFVVENADAESLGNLLYRIVEDYLSNMNIVVYKHYERRDLPCAPYNLFNGIYAKGSDVARMLDANLNLQGDSGFSSGFISGGANYSASKKMTGNYYYEYRIDIVLPGNNWRANSCVQCRLDDPEVLGVNC